MPSPDATVPDYPLSVLVVGAHIDDCEITAGGVAAKYAALGHDVRFHSLTNGDAGHHEIGGRELARTRRAEGRAAADVIGIEFSAFDIHDGELRPTVDNREAVVRLIREVEADLVLTHRPNDYHPDHRYGAELVRDAIPLVTNPGICPDVEPLDDAPVAAFLYDEFEKPVPLDPDVVVSIDDVIEPKLDMLHRHTSQVYEWLPYNQGVIDEVPADEEARRAWLAEEYGPRFERVADRFRDRLIDEYGEEHGSSVTYAEAFESCECGGALTEENRGALFPFLPE